jgi:HK97 family phage major capsid protein
MSQMLDNLRDSRRSVYTEATRLAQSAADEKRAFTEGEESEWQRLNAMLDSYDARIKMALDTEQRSKDIETTFGNLHGRPADPNAPRTLSGADAEYDKAFRSAIRSKNPARSGQWNPGIEFRDTLKSTATQALPVSLYDRVVMHMVESSAVLRAGATVLNTDSGEDLQVPKSTAYTTAAITSEGSSITESDPTLAVTTLKAYKYATFFQVSSELLTDGSPDLLNFLAKQAGEAMAVAYGPHLITGTGTGQPTGAVTSATTGVTGPAGTSTGFGVQATAGMGTDLLNSLVASLAEPYVQEGPTAFLMRNATRAAVANLKTSTGDLVGSQYMSTSPYPFLVDPNMAAMGVSAKSVIFGDWSRYFVRIAGGLRFERDDSYAFQSDLASFRCLLRLDAALVDANALKVLVHSAT